MITGLNHIAIAVPNFEEAIERFLLDFGLNYKGVEGSCCQDKTYVLDIRTQIELIHPLSEDSPVQKSFWISAVVACIIFASTVMRWTKM